MAEQMLEKFSNPLKSVLTRALVFAAERGAETITPSHLLWALATEQEAVSSAILHKARINLESIMTAAPGARGPVADFSPESVPNLAEETRRILEKAILAANLHDHPFVSTPHVLFGFLQVHQQEVSALLFTTANVERRTFEHHIIKALKDARVLTIDEQKKEEATTETCEQCGESHDGESEKSALEYFGIELTAKDRQSAFLPLVGRDDEIERLALILTRKTKNNPLLLGEPGVGKTAIVEGLAQRIIAGTVPAALKEARIFSLDMAGLVAGAMYRGDFEARLLDILEEVAEMKQAILFIDEVHTVVGAGSGGSALDASNIMKPALARGNVRIIGATTFEEYKKHIEIDGALTRRFIPITVSEPSAKDTLKILEGILPTFTSFHKVTLKKQLLSTIVEHAERYLPIKRFPDKAIDILDELGARCAGRAIEHADILATVSRITGMPLEQLSVDEKQKLRNVKEELREHILGQDQAVAAIADALQKAKLGMSPLNRPLASFLFAGPSGVGKTELGKAVARVMFGDEKALVRLDMTEYNEGHSVSKLTGAPAGYVGYRDRARLTDAVKERPHCVVLCDELEKAHRDVQNLLLHILEEGELRDSAGTLINFRNVIIIATTNAGREKFERGQLGFAGTHTNTELDARSLLEDAFKSELLNRFDRICLFQPLTTETYAGIAQKELRALSQRLQKQHRSLTVDRHVIEHIANTVSHKKGARDIRHLIAQLIEKPLTETLLTEKSIKKALKVKKDAKGKIVIV